MYLKNSNPSRRRNNWRLRIWLLLAIAYITTGLAWYGQTRPLAFVDPPPAAVVSPTPDRLAEASDLFERGEIYWQQGNLTAARESYEEAVAADPTMALAYARWGIILTLQQKSEEALIRTERGVALAPDDPQVLAAHGMALEWAARIPEAIQYLERATELDPTYSTAHAFLAEAYTDSARYDEGLALAQEATEMNPDDMWAWRNLGWAYENLGADYYDDAMTAYRKALEIQPISWLYMWLGRHEMVATNYDAALLYFQEATLVDPRSPLAYAELGRAHWLLQNYDTAIEVLETGIEQDPSYGLNYAYLGYVYYNQRNFEQAIEEMERAVSFGYTSEQVYYNLGLANAYLAQCDQAMPWFDRALALNPQSPPALEGAVLCGAPTPTAVPVDPAATPATG